MSRGDHDQEWYKRSATILDDWGLTVLSDSFDRCFIQVYMSNVRTQSCIVAKYCLVISFLDTSPQFQIIRAQISVFSCVSSTEDDHWQYTRSVTRDA